MDSSGDGRWLTYDEIAEARGTEKIGAIRWVQRHKWRRQPGNDGLVRVLVPPEALVRTALRGQQSRTVTPLPDSNAVAAFEAALAALREAHAGELAAVHKAHDSDLTVLREQLSTTRERHAEELAAVREQLRTAETRHAEESDLLHEQLRTAVLRAEALIAKSAELGEHLRTTENRAGTAEKRLEALRVSMEQVEDAYAAQLAAAKEAASRAEEQAEAVQAIVDELRAGQGRHADELERARAEAHETTEAHIAALEADAAEKEARIAQAEADLAAAQRDAQVALQAAAEAREAEAVRKGRGRWARLRAAWRGG